MQELVNSRDCFSLVAINNGKTRCTTWGIEVDRRITRHRRMPGDLERDTWLSAEEEIARVMNCVIDRLQQEISIWFLSKNLKHQILIFNKRQNSSRWDKCRYTSSKLLRFWKFLRRWRQWPRIVHRYRRLQNTVHFPDWSSIGNLFGASWFYCFIWKWRISKSVHSTANTSNNCCFNFKLWAVLQQTEAYFVLFTCFNGTRSSLWSCTP